MIDSSILARLCVPEAPDVAATVSVRELWQWTWNTIEGSPGGGEIVEKWATKKFEENVEHRANYRLRSAVDALLTTGLKKRVFTLRVHDGQQAWRVPPEAFAGWFDGMDLEMTWAVGRLWQFDATDRFRPLADLELPLLMTETEARTFKSKVEAEIAHVQDVGDYPIRVTDAEVDAWVNDWAHRHFWPIREAMLWVATLDFREAARLALGTIWSRCEDLGLVGSAQASADVEGQAAWRRIVEPQPEQALVTALRNGRVRSHGLYEGHGPMKFIEPVDWTRLIFDVPPRQQWDRSDAHKSAARALSQVRGTNWRGHWTGIVIERDGLMQTFEAQALGDAGALTVAQEREVSELNPIRRLGDAPAARRFASWVEEQMRLGRLPTPDSCYKQLAKDIGRSRGWARERVGDLPSILRYARGQKSAEIRDEHWAAYFDHFGQV